MLQQMRAAHPVLLDGIRSIEHLDEHQAHLEGHPEETATIVINRGSQPIPPPDGVTAAGE